MIHLLFLVLIIIESCVDNLPIVIDHGDYETKVVTDNGNFLVNTFHKEYYPSPYVLKNDDTKEYVDFIIPTKKTDKNSILHQINRVSQNGRGYYYSYYATANHQTRQDYINTEDNNLKVFGSYSYIDPNGNANIVNYTADENGYHTKVTFGTKLNISISDELSSFQEELARRNITLHLDELILRAKGGKGKDDQGKNIDGTILGSLIGSGV